MNEKHPQTAITSRTDLLYSKMCTRRRMLRHLGELHQVDGGGDDDGSLPVAAFSLSARRSLAAD